MKTAMILAAGRGERLRPISDTLPKPLCRVNNIPLIEYHISKLADMGIQRIIINHSYLGGQIRKQVGNGSRWKIDIIYSPEPPGGLETGGGICNALSLIGTEPFITVNADIFTQYDFATLKLPLRSMAHLVLVPKPTYAKNGDFGLSSSGLINNETKEYTFSGIACYQPDIFKNKGPNRFSVAPMLFELAAAKQATGEMYDGEWLDIGTVLRLKRANDTFS